MPFSLMRTCAQSVYNFSFLSIVVWPNTHFSTDFYHVNVWIPKTLWEKKKTNQNENENENTFHLTKDTQQMYRRMYMSKLLFSFILNTGNECVLTFFILYCSIFKTQFFFSPKKNKKKNKNYNCKNGMRFVYLLPPEDEEKMKFYSQIVFCNLKN